MPQLVEHVLSSGDIIPNHFNNVNETNFSHDELENAWIQFVNSDQPLTSPQDKTPKIQLSDVQQIPQKQHLLIRFNDQISRRKQTQLPKKIFAHPLQKLAPTTTLKHKQLTQFLSLSDLEYDILLSQNQIKPKTLAIIHSLKTIQVTTKEITYLHSFSSMVSPKNAAIFFDLEMNNFCLVNCGYDGDMNESIGVEIQGIQLKNGQKCSLSNQKAVFRVAGVWHLWRPIKTGK
ncbi:hypothetical protein SS50377_23132 [Spironucleus salmonicida]|uniref:Uncharacterized protein n=1 Tax=Spironucleus salmonicida TaxID=348837 RepID=V6LBB9_9EUKA|nr:hypothetical protein SS50377_23132 [Spironucleus salmonicida]|eukprot:EST41692.1 Hypothetical protein SS50377_18780 [Spironucleus salmonicida]